MRILPKKNKLSEKTKMSLEITDTSKKPFEKCVFDIIESLKQVTNILTFQDNLTKFNKAI